jgi:hypothetical protein
MRTSARASRIIFDNWAGASHRIYGVGLIELASLIFPKPFPALKKCS